MPYLTAGAKEALEASVRTIEHGSSAELVIAVRPSSVPAQAPAASCAVVAALLGLAFLMFSPVSFSHEAIWLDTALCALIGAACALRFDGLRRAFTWPGLARRAVQQAAAAEFVARGITRTRARTGILVYVSQRERRAAVLADVGIAAAVDARAFGEAVSAIEAEARRADGQALARAIGGLAPLLAVALPRGADDLNELEDAL
jgi:putative membrane protein